MGESRNPESAGIAVWATPREALRVACLPTTLRRTLVIAVIVGTLLSIVNQADVIIHGDATAVTWIRVSVNYLVPFCVSTAGFLGACRAST